MKKIIIIDDHQLLREGINSWVSSNSDWQVLAKLGNLEEVKAFIESYTPSKTDCVVAIVDLSFKVSGTTSEKLYGFEILKMFKNPDLNIKTLVYSSHEAGGIIAHSLSKEIGAFGYVSKNSDCDTILCALEAIAKGEKFIQPNLLTSYINAQTKLNMLTNREHPSGGFVHIRHQKRIRQGGITVQIFVGLDVVMDAPGGKNHGGKRGISGSYQGIYCPWIRLVHIPNSVFHVHTHPIITFSLYYNKNRTDAQ